MKFGDFFRSKRLKYGNIFKTHILGKPTIRVIGCDVIRKLLQGEHTTIRACWPKAVRSLLGSKGLAMSDGQTHKHVKQSVLKAFSQKALQSYTTALAQVCNKQSCDSWFSYLFKPMEYFLPKKHQSQQYISKHVIPPMFSCNLAFTPQIPSGTEFLINEYLLVLVYQRSSK